MAAQAASGVSVPKTSESCAWKKAFTNSCGNAWSVGFPSARPNVYSYIYIYADSK
jgi:hypothetical protein